MMDMDEAREFEGAAMMRIRIEALEAAPTLSSNS